MTNRKAINAIALATTVVAWSSFSVFLHPHPPKIDRRPHEELGEVLAAEALKRLEPGARILVIARESEPFRVPASAAQLDGFLRALEKAGAHVAALHTIVRDPLRVTAVPPGDFFDLIRFGRDNDVIVSFLGPPVLDSEQLAMLGKRRPCVLAVCSGEMPAQVDLKKIFDQRLLAAAVLSRSPGTSSSSAGGKRSTFDQLFLLVTSADFEGLSGVPQARRSLRHG